MLSQLRRIWLLAFQCLKEVLLYNRWFQLCLVGLLLFVSGGRLLMTLPLGESGPKLFFDFGRLTIQIVAGTLMVILLSYQLSHDLQQKIVYGYLVRGVSRFEYLVGKLLGTWLALVLAVGVSDCVLALIVNSELAELKIVNEVQRSFGEVNWFVLFLFQIVHLWLLATLILFIGSLSESFLFVCLASLLVWVSGFFVVGMSITPEAVLGVVGFLFDAFRWVIPQFEPIKMGDQLWYGARSNSSGYLTFLLRALLSSACFIGIARWVFNKREL